MLRCGTAVPFQVLPPNMLVWMSHIVCVMNAALTWIFGAVSLACGTSPVILRHFSGTSPAAHFWSIMFSVRW